MNRKATYVSPSCICLEIREQQDLLLRTSCGQAVVDVFGTEPAGRDVGGLSRRRNKWDDEDDEDED